MSVSVPPREEFKRLWKSLDEGDRRRIDGVAESGGEAIDADDAALVVALARYRRRHVLALAAAWALMLAGEIVVFVVAEAASDVAFILLAVVTAMMLVSNVFRARKLGVAVRRNAAMLRDPATPSDAR